MPVQALAPQALTPPASPTMTIAPAPPAQGLSDAQWLMAEGDWLTGIDKIGSGISGAIDAILKNTSYGPGDLPVNVLQGLQNGFYTQSATSGGQPVVVLAPNKLAEDAARLRRIADNYVDLQKQVTALQQELAAAKNAVVVQQPSAAPPVVVTASTPAQTQSSATTLLVGVGVLAAAGIGAWWLWSKYRPRVAREASEEIARRRR